MTTVIRPIRYTAQLPQMRAWAERLGLAVLVETDCWVVLAAGSGRLALHAVEPGDPAAGSTTLAVETDDLDALAATWEAAGIATRREDAHDIPLLFGTTPFGGVLAAGELAPDDGAAPRDADLAVMPMLVASGVDGAAAWFASWGLRPRVVGERGGWADLEAPDGGLVAVHGAGSYESEPPPSGPEGPAAGERELGVSLTFEHPDVDALLERLRAAGVEDARVHDESYNRTLILGCPDGDEIWVNGVMTDLYGYRRV